MDDKKKSKKKLISNLIFLGLMTILVIILVFSLGDLQNIASKFQEITQGNNWAWLIAAFGLCLAYFALWPLSQCIYGKALKVNASFTDSYLIGNSEHFYNGITPFAAGGQPFQIYSYTKRNTTTAKATGVVLASYATFMLVTNAFAIISLIFYPQIEAGLKQMNLEWLKYIALLGFIINFFVLICTVALGTSRHLKGFFVKILTFFANLKMFHKERKHNWSNKLFNGIGKLLVNSIPTFTQYCDNTQTAFKEVWNHKLASLLAILIKIVAMACYYAIPFFIVKSVGIEIGADTFILVLFSTSFAITSVVWMPTPGGTAGIEFAFMIVLAAATGQATSDAQAVVLIWRMLTFYFILILSFICSAIFEAKASKSLKKEAKPLENISNDSSSSN